MPNQFQRLNALLPADATGAFVAIQAALNQFQPDAPFFTAVFTIVMIGIIALSLPFYAKRLLHVRSHVRIGYLVATFVIWSLSITSEIHFDNLAQNMGVSDANFFVIALRVLVIFWTFLVLPIAAAREEHVA